MDIEWRNTKSGLREKGSMTGKYSNNELDNSYNYYWDILFYLFCVPIACIYGR